MMTDNALLGLLQDASETVRIAPVPVSVSRRLRDLFASPGRDLAAELVDDTRLHRELVGIRGPSVPTSWTLAFLAPWHDIAVDVTPVDSWSVDVDIQIVRFDGRPTSCAVELTGSVRQRAATDRLGRCRFEGVAVGRHEVAIDEGAVVSSFTVDFTP